MKRAQPACSNRRQNLRLMVAGSLFLMATCNLGWAQIPAVTGISAEHDPRLRDFQVFEFRRYKVKEGEREHFALYFDTYFPDAFQQLGAIVAGSLLERGNRDGFTWIRGFHTIDDRAVANAAFYYGSLWNEHRDTLNNLMVDSDNVLLLRPLSPEHSIITLPAVDPVTEPDGARGIVVAQVFAVKPNSVDAFAKAAETTFAEYRAAGAREAGILLTLDVKNNFPQLPIRTDGPFLVWLGILKDNQMLDTAFMPVVERSVTILTGTGLLRGTPELIVLDPTRRSRLRWLR